MFFYDSNTRCICQKGFQVNTRVILTFFQIKTMT